MIAASGNGMDPTSLTRLLSEQEWNGCVHSKKEVKKDISVLGSVNQFLTHPYEDSYKV